MSKENQKRKEKGRKELGKKRKYSRLGSLGWATKQLWGLDRWFIFFIFAAFIPEVLYALLQDYFPKALIDRISAGAAFRELFFLAFGLIVVQKLLELLRDFMNAKRGGRKYYPTAVFQTRMRAWEDYEMDYENTLKQDFKEIRGYAWGDAYRGDCSMEFFWEDLSGALFHIAGIVTYVSLLTVLNPLLIAVVAVTAAASYFTSRWQPVYYEKNKHKWEKEIRKSGYLRGLSENFSLAKDIRLYGMENWLDRLLQGYQDIILSWNKRCSLRETLARLLYVLIDLLQRGAVYFVLIATLVKGSITVGEFVFYFNMLLSLGSFFESVIQDVAKLNTRAEKIAYYREFYDYPDKFNHGKGCELPDMPVTIELRNVHYRYDGAQEDTLKGINLTIRGGEKLALVGVNGAGKTTLVKLICGLFAPTEGEILVNGKRIPEYNIEEYYSMISVVFQEVCAIAFTIFEFVASSDLDRLGAREDAARAMRAAGIYEKIQSLPSGMDTHLVKGIYDDGVELSGGEMQKLVLARAIYKDGGILVLDEPTAALDPIAENQLYQQYRKFTEGKTSVYISHRFASTRFCDRIVLLEEGVIKETGTHEELMEKNGRYAYMFGVQSKYYKEEQANG